MWTEIIDENEYQKALKCARGVYQRAFLTGSENLSASTLRGKAQDYSSRYKESRGNLLSRMTCSGVKWSEKTGENNKRILVIGV